jgi:hypothetical protein
VIPFPASGLIGSPTEPSTRSDLRLAVDPFVAFAHQRAQGRGSAIEDLDFILVDDLPEPAGSG